MRRFAQLLDRLYFTASHRAKSVLIRQYLAEVPDPDRGWAVAALAGTLSFDRFKRNFIKQLILTRVDPLLYNLSYDYVGETGETVALLWPAEPVTSGELPALHTVVETLQSADRETLMTWLSACLDRMTPAERWALIKLGTGELRIGISARFLKRILAEYGGVPVEQIERLWHGQAPPYQALLRWLDGHGGPPETGDQIIFHPVMLSHPLLDSEIDQISAEIFQAEYKFDGIRVQYVGTPGEHALFSRTGDNISGSFPDLMAELKLHAVLDGELLVRRDGAVASFNDLQQRLNKKKPGAQLMKDYPALLMVYDALSLNGEDLTALPLSGRRAQLEQWLTQHLQTRLALSPLLTFASADDLHRLRNTAETEGGRFVEGLMLKRKTGMYRPGRPKGEWYKWKRDPQQVDAVMMYAQRGHGKRSSFYSDYTFGLWQGDQLLPIGKAYSGFTDEELKRLDNWVRNHTVGRFGPVREVEKALVLEVAFDAVQESRRHKSGVALRFPRIARVRWDKPAAEADRLDEFKRLHSIAVE